MFSSRALFRMLHKARGVKFFGLIPEDDKESPLDEIIGFLVAAGIGFCSQLEMQFKNEFSFEVPLPISLVTWPFDWAETWIQWQPAK